MWLQLCLGIRIQLVHHLLEDLLIILMIAFEFQTLNLVMHLVTLMIRKEVLRRLSPCHEHLLNHLEDELLFLGWEDEQPKDGNQCIKHSSHITHEIKDWVYLPLMNVLLSINECRRVVQELLSVSDYLLGELVSHGEKVVVTVLVWQDTVVFCLDVVLSQIIIVSNEVWVT